MFKPEISNILRLRECDLKKVQNTTFVGKVLSKKNPISQYIVTVRFQVLILIVVSFISDRMNEDNVIEILSPETASDKNSNNILDNDVMSCPRLQNMNFQHTPLIVMTKPTTSSWIPTLAN